MCTLVNIYKIRYNDELLLGGAPIALGEDGYDCLL
jgi:hypothetical protein